MWFKCTYWGLYMYMYIKGWVVCRFLENHVPTPFIPRYLDSKSSDSQWKWHSNSYRVISHAHVECLPSSRILVVYEKRARESLLILSGSIEFVNRKVTLFPNHQGYGCIYIYKKRGRMSSLVFSARAFLVTLDHLG